jgi:nitrogen fixation protein
VDYDGSVLKEEVVSSGNDATAYAFKASEKPPEGYNRIGWDKSFDNITEDTTVTATYEAKKYTVEFYMPDGSLIEKKENVEYGSIVEEPVYAEHYFDWDNPRMGVFTGWNKDLKEKITANTSIYAQYEKDFEQPVISIDTTSTSASIDLYVPGGCYLYAIDLGFHWTGSIAIEKCEKNIASSLYKGNFARGSFDYNNKNNRFYYAWVDGAGVAVPQSDGRTYSFTDILDISFKISEGFKVNKDALKLFEDCTISIATKPKAKIDEIQTITPIIVVK